MGMSLDSIHSIHKNPVSNTGANEKRAGLYACPLLFLYAQRQIIVDQFRKMKQRRMVYIHAFHQCMR